MATPPDAPGLELEAAGAAPSSSADLPAFPAVPSTVGRVESIDVGPLIIGADGLPMPPGVSGYLGDAPPIPPADAAHIVCLRGPCRHLWEMQVHFDTGNPADTWHPTRGLKEGTIQCPACKGASYRVSMPLLASGDEKACGYQPNQGGNRDRRCRLLEDHEGAHFYADTKPLPVREPCPRCGGTGTVADPSGKPIRQPRRVTRSCIRHPGVEQDLDETAVYACDQWDPRQPDPELDGRRRAYLEQHPEAQTPE